jgi:hypothetical protein
MEPIAKEDRAVDESRRFNGNKTIYMNGTV